MPCSPRMRACPASCGHYQFVEAFRLQRAHEEQVAEAVSLGYDTELAEYLETNPLTTFKEWLIGHRKQQEVAA